MKLLHKYKLLWEGRMSGDERRNKGSRGGGEKGRETGKVSPLLE